MGARRADAAPADAGGRDHGAQAARQGSPLGLTPPSGGAPNAPWLATPDPERLTTGSARVRGGFRATLLLDGREVWRCEHCHPVASHANPRGFLPALDCAQLVLETVQDPGAARAHVADLNRRGHVQPAVAALADLYRGAIAAAVGLLPVLAGEARR